MTPGRLLHSSPTPRRTLEVLVVVAAVVLSLVLTAESAAAAVSVSRAELSGTSLRLEGTATASRDITVDGAVMGRSDSGGRFRIERSGYTAPADCTVDVNDGSATPRVATLSGCTVRTPPPPPPPPPSGPAAPAPLAPANGASVTSPVTLSWSATIDPNPASQNGGYNWRVSSSPTFGTLVARDSTLPSATRDSVTLAAGTYYWQVQAVDGALESSAWSAAASFVVTGEAAGALGAPTLATLIDGGQYHPMENFPISWTAVTGASSYVVEASQDPAFPAPVEVRFDNIPEPRYSLTFHSSLIGSWNLRVRAVGADGVAGAPSNVRTFSVSYGAPIGPPPVPVSPADGATVTLPFVLDWEDVSNPQSSGYVVEIARDPSFDDVEALSTGLTGSRWEILGLSSGTKYWRVQHAEGDSSPTTAAFTAPSDVRSFTVAGGEGAVASVRLFDSPTAYSGTDRFGEVQLTALAPGGGAVVELASSDPRAVPVPATVTVPAGQSTQQFRVVYGQVTVDTPVTVTATYAGSTATTSTTVVPTALERLGPGGNEVTGGAAASAFVELRGAAPPEGAEVALTSSSELAVPPSTVTVPAGGFLQHFPIRTNAVETATTVTITAAWRGRAVTQELVLNPGVPPATWTLERTTTTGSEGSNARVAIDAVRTTDTTFTLTSSNPDIAFMSPTVTIPAGSPHAGVLVHTRNPAAPTAVTLSVSGGGGTKSAVLTVNPIPLAPLPAPSLVAPANGSRFDAGRTIPFDWSNVTNAASYTLQVGTTSTFGTVVLTRTVTTSQVSAALTGSGDRSWRVRANRSDGSAGAWSAVRSIRIR